MCSIAAIKIAQKQAGIGDDEYRAMIVQLTHKTSSTVMTDEERNKVLSAIKKRIDYPKKAQFCCDHTPTAKKLWALWYALKPRLSPEERTNQYLIGICRKANYDVPTITDPNIQSPVQMRNSIEALKARIAQGR